MKIGVLSMTKLTLIIALLLSSGISKGMKVIKFADEVKRDGGGATDIYLSSLEMKYLYWRTTR